MAVAGLVVLSGCSTALAACKYNNLAEPEVQRTAAELPSDCRFTGAADGNVRTISCADGRQGVAVLDGPQQAGPVN